MSLLQETSRETVDALLARVHSIPGRRRLRAWLFPIAMIVLFPAAMAELEAKGHLNLDSSLVALALTFVSCLWGWLAAEWRDMRAVEALAACREMRTLGALLESLKYSNRRARNAVQRTLIELLPRLCEDDSALLNSAQCEILNGLLYDRSGELAMATLTALERVGNVTALPYLTSMANGKGVTSALRNRQAEIQERAQHAVQNIADRIERQNRANVLLRGAQMPATPASQLVRPAQGHTIGNGHDLLRPDAGGQPDPEHTEKRL